jgi:hypothetical protein
VAAASSGQTSQPINGAARRAPERPGHGVENKSRDEGRGDFVLADDARVVSGSALDGRDDLSSARH